MQPRSSRAQPSLSSAVTTGFAAWAVGAVLITVGSALGYPTLIAAVGDVAHPIWRATVAGVYRLCSAFDLCAAVMAVAVLSLVSGSSSRLR